MQAKLHYNLHLLNYSRRERSSMLAQVEEVGGMAVAATTVVLARMVLAWVWWPGL